MKTKKVWNLATQAPKSTKDRKKILAEFLKSQ